MTTQPNGGFVGITYVPDKVTTSENITTFNSPGTFTAQSSDQTVADIFILDGGGGGKWIVTGKLI